MDKDEGQKYASHRNGKEGEGAQGYKADATRLQSGECTSAMCQGRMCREMYRSVAERMLLLSKSRGNSLCSGAAPGRRVARSWVSRTAGRSDCAHIGPRLGQHA